MKATSAITVCIGALLSAPNSLFHRPKMLIELNIGEMLLAHRAIAKSLDDV